MLSKTALSWILVALVCVVLAPTSSDADVLAETIFSIEAQALGGGDSISFDVPLNSATVEGNALVWELVQEVALGDIAVLRSARVAYSNYTGGSRGGTAAESVAVNFLVTSGAAGANFVVTSAPLTFFMPNAVGRATAGTTVTDNGGDGAGLFGNFSDNSVFRSYYNDAGSAATGASFATLVPGISGGSGSTIISVQNFPDELVTFSGVDENNVLLGSVSSMSSQWRFGVAPNNSAAGTSSFELIPEPGSSLLWIFGSALLVLMRRR